MQPALGLLALARCRGQPLVVDLLTVHLERVFSDETAELLLFHSLDHVVAHAEARSEQVIRGTSLLCPDRKLPERAEELAGGVDRQGNVLDE
jgi:hypothetical protein